MQRQERKSGSLAQRDGLVYFGSRDNHLYAVESKTGKKKWKFKTEGSINTSPVIVDDVIYFGSNDSYVYALDLKTGKELWKYKTEGWQLISSPAVSDGVVFIGSCGPRDFEGHYLYAIY